MDLGMCRDLEDYSNYSIVQLSSDLSIFSSLSTLSYEA